VTEEPKGTAEFLLYQCEDGRTRVEVRFEGETAWLSLAQMSDLFQRDKSVISRHIKNVFDDGELDRRSEDLPGRVLQPRRDHLRRLPGEVAPRDPVPDLGDAAARRVHRQGLHAGRRASQAGRWRLSERNVLAHAGRVSHEAAVSKAELEYDRFAAVRAALAGPVVQDFDQAIRDVKQIERTRRPSNARKPPSKGRRKP
jgi:hypothetical protein